MIYEKKQELIRLDDVTRHSQNVSFLVDTITEKMDMNDLDRRIVKCSAIYHDTGKGFVNQKILYKTGTLTEDEKKEVRRHAKLGADYMRKNKHLKYYADFVLFHHENYDGSGYFGVSGEKIPLTSRIIRLADYFDALCDDRPYRSAYSIEEALKIMEEDSSVFDPLLFDSFLSLFRVRDETERRIRELYENCKVCF